MQASDRGYGRPDFRTAPDPSRPHRQQGPVRRCAVVRAPHDETGRAPTPRGCLRGPSGSLPGIPAQPPRPGSASRSRRAPRPRPAPHPPRHRPGPSGPRSTSSRRACAARSDDMRGVATGFAPRVPRGWRDGREVLNCRRSARNRPAAGRRVRNRATRKTASTFPQPVQRALQKTVPRPSAKVVPNDGKGRITRRQPHARVMILRKPLRLLVWRPRQLADRAHSV